MRHDSFICDVTHWHVIPDMARRIHTCEMSHSRVCQDRCTGQPPLLYLSKSYFVCTRNARCEWVTSNMCESCHIYIKHVTSHMKKQSNHKQWEIRYWFIYRILRYMNLVCTRNARYGYRNHGKCLIYESHIHMVHTRFTCQAFLEIHSSSISRAYEIDISNLIYESRMHEKCWYMHVQYHMFRVHMG